MTDLNAELPADASVWERELLEHLTTHVQVERGMLESYVAASKDSSSKALAYIVDLLVEDEKRHHALFQALAESLKHDANFRPGDPQVPRLDFDRADSTAVRGLTEQLLQQERDDLRELRKLQKDLRDVKDTTLWSLLAELMERDTEKHISMLRFVEDHM